MGHAAFYRLVEEADYKSTAELFAKKGDEKTLDNFIPKTESDFLEYAELVAHKLRPYEVCHIHLICALFICAFQCRHMTRQFHLLQKSYHYIGLLKAVMRLSLTSLKGADAKEVASSVTAIANEKIKAEKEANAGKKKTGKDNKLLLVILLGCPTRFPNEYFLVYRREEETAACWQAGR